MSEHARLSPSGAERWMICHGAPRMEERFDEEVSEFAAEGTAAHHIREMCLTSGKDVVDFLGEIVVADDIYFEVTQEWVYYIQPGIDRVRESKAKWVYEHRTVMEPWIPGGFGTLDTGGITADEITIDDFKFGAGIEVEAERNKQLMIYALGFWENYAKDLTDATDFLLRIDQPRIAGGGREWRTTLDELLAFGEEVKIAVAMVEEADAADEDDLDDYLHPTADGCRFCRAARAGGCRKLDAFVLDLLGLSYKDLNTIKRRAPELADPQEMTPERRSFILENKTLINNWLKTLHGNALDDALKGNPVPGYKAVNTEGDRAWADPQLAEEFWHGKLPDKELYDRNLKSPAKMEKLAGTRNWAKAQALIVRPEGAPALVKLSDRRPAIVPLVNLLDDLLDDNDDDLIASSDDLDDLI